MDILLRLSVIQVIIRTSSDPAVTAHVSLKPPSELLRLHIRLTNRLRQQPIIPKFVAMCTELINEYIYRSGYCRALPSQISSQGAEYPVVSLDVIVATFEPTEGVSHMSSVIAQWHMILT